MTEARRTPSQRRPNRGGVIESVREGSLADEIGLLAGDRVTAIDGRRLRDAVDFQFYAADEVIQLEVVRDEIVDHVDVEKHPDEDLGLSFQDAAFDGVKTCNNSCFFCFLKGNPKGLRKTLYVKDDDYRLSFFHGNFVTLTNLTEDDWSRLEEQRLSPINVSVHATDVELRRYLLGNKTAPDICAQLRRLGDLGIQSHTQIVLCPGVNDGPALTRTIDDLSVLYPSVQTISVVPVGATNVAEERIERQRHSDEIDGCSPEHARAVLTQVQPYQRRFRRELKRTLVYLADEYYLIAGMEPPGPAHYDGFAQYENGIGMARSLIEDWKRTVRKFPTGIRPAEGVRRITIACGTLIAPTLSKLATEFAALAGVEVNVLNLANAFFGPRVNVSGLLVGREFAQELRGRDLGDLVVLPRYALDYTGGRFLDDWTPAQLQAELRTPLAFATTLSEVIDIVREPQPEMSIAGAHVSETSSNGKAWVDWAAL